MRTVVFTDLDGTLLSYEDYSFTAADEALKKLREHDIPLVFCTSKTRKEIEFWRKQLDNHDPFISENGGGIFIPKDYFDYTIEYDSEFEEYYVIKLGEDISYLKQGIRELKETYALASFIDMTPREIREDTGLDLKQAALAKQREFDIPIKLQDESKKPAILEEIKNRGLQYMVGGRFIHLTGDNDKGKAVKILTGLYEKQYGTVLTFGLGDSHNDFSMLDVVDNAYLVKRRNGTYATEKYNKADGVGPEGWNQVVLRDVIK